MSVITFRDFVPPARFDIPTPLPWIEARIEESTASTGEAWTEIETITLDPVDPDPTAPLTRNITTEEASDTAGLWYRVVFVDADGDEAQPSQPLRNTDPAASAFATHTELGARLGITLMPDEADRADILIGLASGLVRRATRQTITLVTDDTLTIRGSYASRITLPQRPVVDVTAVTLNGVELVGGSWYLDGNEIVRTHGTGNFWVGSGYGGSFGCPSDTLVVTYSHGYAEIPDEVKATVLEMVQRVWNNPAVTTRETNGSSDVMYAPSNGLLLTDTERRTVNDALRRQAASIALR